MDELQDYDWLVKHKHMKSRELAEMLGCSKGKVDYAYCKAKIRRKVVRPDKATLGKMAVTMTNSEIAREFGVSDTTVHYWLKAYGIENKYTALPHRVMTLRDQGYSRRKIAKMLDCRYSYVAACLGGGYVPPTRDYEINPCFIKLARRMLDGTWNGEWCGRTERVRRDRNKMGFW